MIVDCPQCSRRHVILQRAAGTVARCECGREFGLPADGLAGDVIKCANCGANPPAGANHCPYCDAHLTNVRCARCFAQSTEGDNHCRACGHALATPIQELGPRPERVYACPRCENALRAIMSGDALLDECTRCGGLWLAHDVFREVLISEQDHSRLLAALDNLRPALPTEMRLRPEDDQRFYVPCPECEQVMDRRQFARISGVVVDVCVAHGVWFDHDELPRIVQFARDGGLERAEQKMRLERLADDALLGAYRPGDSSARARTVSHLTRLSHTALLTSFLAELLG